MLVSFHSRGPNFFFCDNRDSYETGFRLAVNVCERPTR